MVKEPGTITDLLVAWSEGEQEALGELMPLVYDHLRGMAANHLRNERPDHTLETKALVNEAFLRLVRQEQVPCRGREQFFAIAARMMRRILVDHARSRDCAKRDGGEMVSLTLEAFDRLPTEDPQALLALDDALKDLAKHDPVQAKIVEMRYFGGLNKDEMATVLDISPATVTRRFKLARAWLYRTLIQEP